MVCKSVNKSYKEGHRRLLDNAFDGAHSVSKGKGKGKVVLVLN